MARKAADDRIGPYMPRPGPVVRVLVARVIEAEQIEGRILTDAGMISIGHNAAGLAAGPGCVYRMQPRDGLSGCVQNSRYDALDSGVQFPPRLLWQPGRRGCRTRVRMRRPDPEHHAGQRARSPHSHLAQQECMYI